ncbi:efflux transporter outer membrane subunit [Nitrospira sp. Nam74]
MRMAPVFSAGFIAVVGATTACTLGPDYRAPEPPAVAQYTATPVPEETAGSPGPGGEAQRFVVGRDIPSEWWKVFQSEALDELIHRALSDSPTLIKTQARLRQAQEQLTARTGQQFPKVDAGLSGYAIGIKPDNLGGTNLPFNTPLNLYLATINVSYTLDLFGSQRRELEALRSSVDYQRFEIEGARLMLAGNVVTSVIREALLRERITRINELIAIQARQLAIAEQRQRTGAIPVVELAQQRGALAQTRATLPELQLQLEQVRHRLAVYIGQPPGLEILPEFRLSDLRLPSELPVSIPSELARQRPDIQAAEALLHQASARVGVATANRFPQLSLSAMLGSLSTDPANPLWFYFLAGSLVQPIFHGGSLSAKQREAVAAYEQAGAAYKEVVLQGFREVADSLRALEADAIRLRERTEAALQARMAYDITRKRYEMGAVSHLNVLEAQQQYQQAAMEQAQATADRYANSAALFQALGGGWWSRQDQALKSPPP